MDIKKIVVLGSVLALCLLLLGCDRGREKTYQGYIEGRYVYLASQFAGKLEKLSVKRGDLVEQGELLFKLDSQPEQDDFKKAQGNLKQAKELLVDQMKGQRPDVIAGIIAQREQAQAQLVLNRKTLARYKRLAMTGAIDKASVDKAVADYQANKKKISELNANLAEAKLGSRVNQIMAQQGVVAAAKAAVEAAKWKVEQKTVAAPLAGRIFDTYYREGEVVIAGHPVVSLLVPKRMKLVFFVPETALKNIKIGQKVELTTNGSKDSHEAKISYISSEAEYTPPVIYSVGRSSKLVFRIEASLAGKDAAQLHVGQPVDVRVSG